MVKTSQVSARPLLDGGSRTKLIVHCWHIFKKKKSCKSSSRSWSWKLNSKSIRSTFHYLLRWAFKVLIVWNAIQCLISLKYTYSEEMISHVSHAWGEGNVSVVGRISLFSVSLYNVALSFDVQSTISFPLECNKSPFGYGLWWQFLSLTGLWWSLLF